MMEIEWRDYAHHELDTTTLYSMLALRSQVFVVEQQCPYLDLDGLDLLGDNRHVLALHQQRVLACARILAPADAQSPVAIGCVVISDDARGLRLGVALMQQALNSCERHWPEHQQYLSAQAHLQRFYQQLGFTPYGDVYSEDGIPHISMQRVPSHA